MHKQNMQRSGATLPGDSRAQPGGPGAPPHSQANPRSEAHMQGQMYPGQSGRTSSGHTGSMTQSGSQPSSSRQGNARYNQNVNMNSYLANQMALQRGAHEKRDSSQQSTYLAKQVQMQARRGPPPSNQQMYGAQGGAQDPKNQQHGHPMTSRSQTSALPRQAYNQNMQQQMQMQGRQPMPQGRPSGDAQQPADYRVNPTAMQQHRMQPGHMGRHQMAAPRGNMPPQQQPVGHDGRNDRTQTSTAMSVTTDPHRQSSQSSRAGPQGTSLVPFQGAIGQRMPQDQQQATMPQSDATQQAYYSQMRPQQLMQPPQHLRSHADTNGKPQLQNIVSTAKLGVQLDLYKIALEGANVEYKPKRFAAAIMRIREPKTTALIFRSGKMVCTGAKSELDSHTAAKNYAKSLRKIGNQNVVLTDFTIQNIVGSHDVGFHIKLESLHQQAISNMIKCRYDPELFPGLIFRMNAPKVVLLIFASGKIVLTGAKKREQIYEAYEKILPLLGLHKNRPI